jgi:methyl-accepting chemotaxis protein
MNWTVGRRIATGFAIVLVLLGLVAALGSWALRRTSQNYEDAIAQRRTLLVPALDAETEVRTANVEYLRYLVEGDERFVRSRDSVVARARTLLEELREAAPTPDIRDAWRESLDLLDRWLAATSASVDARREGRLDEALRLRRDQSQPVRTDLDRAIRRGVGRASAFADRTAQAGDRGADDARSLLLTGAILAFLVGLASAILLYNALARPLQETTTGIASGASQILAATTEQAAGANETLAAVSQTVATVDEVAQTAEQATERARLVAESAQRAAEIGQGGRRAVEATVAGIGDVRRQVESIGTSILALAERAQAIGEITDAVTDIADQTNLLALNAAVEAARAGDAGRGFAVVASEIRTLAEQAKRSTVQVRQLLGEVQRATGAAVMATEQGTKQVVGTVRQVEEAGQVIRALADSVQEAAQTSAQIVASARQQALGMEQIRQAIGSIQEATQQNLVASRQTEQAAQDLTRLGTALTALVGTGEAERVRRLGTPRDDGRAAPRGLAGA